MNFMNNNEMNIIVKTKKSKYDIPTQCMYAYDELKKLQGMGIASKESGIMDCYSRVTFNNAGVYNDAEAFYDGITGFYDILFDNDVEKGKEQIISSLSGIESEDIEQVLKNWNNDVNQGIKTSSLNQYEFARNNSSNPKYELFTKEEIEHYISNYTQGRQI